MQERKEGKGNLFHSGVDKKGKGKKGNLGKGREKEEKKRKKEENAAYDPKSSAGRKNDKKKDDVEVEGQGLMLFEDEE